MSTNPIAELSKLGQSVWYDQMQRSLAEEGHLQRMIERDDLRGLTSNPTIFDKAIGGTREYDATLEQLATEGRSLDEIYEAIVVEDIGLAADVFKPVYDRTGALDGYCSLEVSPALAMDTQKTIEQGLRLFEVLGRDNVMIKVPATEAGIPAIEELIYRGVNINVTLIFARSVYDRVIDAYMRGLERRVDEGKAVGHIASVASFFVSRIDSKVDAAIERRLAETTDAAQRQRLESLRGKIAIANAKAAYRLFRERFASERFIRLRDAGAMVQRPLWASTGTKNPEYSDVLYVEALIGADTVNTLPPATYEAFWDHGTVQPTIEADVDEAMEQLALLEQGGISLDAITSELTEEGVRSFADSFTSLMSTIEARRAITLRNHDIEVHEHFGAYTGAIEGVLEQASKEKWVEKIWKKDASLWKSDAAHRELIAGSLGWVTVPGQMIRRLDEVTEFAAEARERFSDVVVLGMGGSSLCSEVLRSVIGAKKGWPKLHVLDSTVPESVRALEQKLDLPRTLFIVASKSGTTTEPMMFFRYFSERIRSIAGERAGEQFVAITDPGTQLERDSRDAGFLRTFLNWEDIGGRYSALSMFGVVPAALAGIDVREFLERGQRAAHACSPSARESNPGLRLGAFMGALASQQIDKLTLLLPISLEPFALWVEQLVAESTGKEGRGIVPIAGEPLREAEEYGNDRAFVAISQKRREDDTIGGLTRDLAAAGRPVLEMKISDPLDVADLFFVFEFATAVAGRVLEVNPFDQPNVQESKSNTSAVLDRVRAEGDSALQTDGRASAESDRGAEALRQMIEGTDAKGYFAILAYIDDNEGHRKLLRELRAAAAAAGKNVTTTSGFGPRYLHSTGQLHKGGDAGGSFLVLTADPVEDVPIPGEKFGFASLAQAQAVGDIESLRSNQRPVLHLHLGADTYDGMRSLVAAVSTAQRKA